MVIPIHDENPVRRTPVMTYTLIAINVVVFLLGPVAGLTDQPANDLQAACTQDTYFRQYGAIPEELIDNKPLPPGRRDPCPAERFDKIPVLSVITAMFVHGGWLHLLGNMLFLLIFGNNVEDHLGRVRYALFYLGGGMVATYAYAALNPDSVQPLVGASGAIAGVLGAYLWLFPRARVTTIVLPLFFLPFLLPAWIVLGSWFVLQWLYANGTGMTGDSNVAYAAHVAGFIAGLVFVVFFVERPRRPPPPRHPPGYPYAR